MPTSLGCWEDMRSRHGSAYNTQGISPQWPVASSPPVPASDHTRQGASSALRAFRKQEPCCPPKTPCAGNPLLVPLSHPPTNPSKWLKTDVTQSQMAPCAHYCLTDGPCGRRTSASASLRGRGQRGLGKEMMPGYLGP